MYGVYRPARVCSLRQAAYYPFCWLIIDSEKLKLNIFLPLIWGVLPVKSPPSSLISQNYISREKKNLGWTNHNNELLPPTMPSNTYQNFEFTIRKKRVDRIRLMRYYARAKEILEFTKFSRSGMHRRHICGTFCKLLTREIHSSR